MLKREVANGRTYSKRSPLPMFKKRFEAKFLMKIAMTFGLLVMSMLGGALPLAAQSSDQGSSDRSSSDRKVISRVEPEYPDALKRLYIGGVVRVEVLVAPSGVVKSTKLLGGSPILGQSTMKAVKQWKYAPATADEVLTVKLEFDPHR